MVKEQNTYNYWVYIQCLYTIYKKTKKKCKNFKKQEINDIYIYIYHNELGKAYLLIPGKKMQMLKNKILSITNLVTTAALNAKINEVEG